MYGGSGIEPYFNSANFREELLNLKSKTPWPFLLSTNVAKNRSLNFITSPTLIFLSGLIKESQVLSSFSDKSVTFIIASLEPRILNPEIRDCNTLVSLNTNRSFLFNKVGRLDILESRKFSSFFTTKRRDELLGEMGRLAIRSLGKLKLKSSKFILLTLVLRV